MCVCVTERELKEDRERERVVLLSLCLSNPQLARLAWTVSMVMRPQIMNPIKARREKLEVTMEMSVHRCLFFFLLFPDALFFL